MELCVLQCSNNVQIQRLTQRTGLLGSVKDSDLLSSGRQSCNKSVSSEGYSAQTELSMTVNVRFTNNKNHAEDFERQFTSTATYETTQSLNAVQEELVTQMVKDICDQIFNATVANW